MNQVKICRVCGDRATGFNYCGLSCESCKVFFLRNISRQQTTKCKWEGSCLINISNRRRCMKCRLEKCLAIGMVKEAKENETNYKIIQVEYGIMYYVEMRILNAILFEKDTEQINQDIELTEKWLKKDKYSNDLNLYELNRMSEIQEAISVFIDETRIRNIRIATDFVDALGTPELYVRMIVKFCKKFHAFNRLGSQDQFILFKPFCYDIMMLRLAFIYDKETNGRIIAADEFGNQGIFCHYPSKSDKNQNLIDFNREFLIALQDEMENDCTIRNLLIVIQLFKQKHPTSSPEFIRYYYIFYSQLLRRYLQHKYSSLRLAKKKFASLLDLLDKMELVKKHRAIVFCEFGNGQLPRVFIELFDLV